MRKTSRVPVQLLRVFLVFLLLGIALSCRREPEPLSMDKMGHLLLEMHVAESYAQFAPKDSLNPGLKNRDSLARYYTLILQENGLTEQQFKQSMDYYKKRPELLDSMYQQILADLLVLQTRINKN